MLDGLEKGSAALCCARHVALGVRHVVLGSQRDVAPPQRRQNSPKVSQKSAPRRIGSAPCRVGPPTRHGSSAKVAKLPKSEPKACATSHWAPAMSRWASNATWRTQARLYHTETDTDKRWRNHFGSRRGDLYRVGGSIELVDVAGCGPIAWFPYSRKLPSDSAAGHDLTRPTHRCCANRRLPCLP